MLKISMLYIYIYISTDKRRQQTTLNQVIRTSESPNISSINNLLT